MFAGHDAVKRCALRRCSYVRKSTRQTPLDLPLICYESLTATVSITAHKAVKLRNETNNYLEGTNIVVFTKDQR